AAHPHPLTSGGKDMSSMTVGRRIILGYAIVLLFAILSAGTGLVTFTLAQQSIEVFLDEDDRLVKLAVLLDRSVVAQSEAFRGYMLYGDKEALERMRELETEFDELI